MGEKEREISMCGCLSCALTGHLACNPGMIPVWESNQRPFDLQPALNPLSYASQGCFCLFLKHFFISGTTRYFRLILCGVFCCLGFFQLENGIRNQNLGAKRVHCYWGFAFFVLSQLTKRRNVCCLLN